MTKTTKRYRRIDPVSLPEQLTDAIRVANEIIDRADVVPVLEAIARSNRGPKTAPKVKAIILGILVTALLGRRLLVAEVLRVLKSLPRNQRTALRLEVAGRRLTYRVIDSHWNNLAAFFEEQEAKGGIFTVDWFIDRLLEASIPAEFAECSSYAMDGIGIPTWATLRYRGKIDTGEDLVPDSATKGTNGALRLKGGPPPLGADGRRIWTADPDARGGYHTATGKKKGHEYVGYELHTLVTVRDFAGTNYVDDVKFGSPVPPLIRRIRVAPAGTHRGDTAVPMLLKAIADKVPIRELIVDRGYSGLVPERFHYPLRRAGVELVMDLYDSDRGVTGRAGDFLVIDGTLFGKLTPRSDQVIFPRAPMNADATTRASYEEPFNRRARYRVKRHGAPDADGFWRAQCPACAGFIRTPVNPRSMRLPKKGRPLVPAGHHTTCCLGIQRIPPAVAAKTLQRIPWGTTAWRMSYSRRPLIETGNSLLKTHVSNLQDGSIRVFGLVKHKLLLAAACVACNVSSSVTFRAERAAEDARRPRPRRRTATYDDLLGTPTGTIAPSRERSQDGRIRRSGSQGRKRVSRARPPRRSPPM